MRYAKRLGASFRDFFHNKSLLSVLLLEFIARIVLFSFFIIINVLIVMLLNQSNILWTPAGTPILSSLMNAKTFVTLTILTIIEFVGFLYVNSFFSAGYFGMLKNIVQDGSTSFDEFIPNAKRYWYPSFRYLAAPYIIAFVTSLPFMYFYGIFVMVAVSGGIMDASSLNIIAMSFGISVLAAVILLYWFSYGPALIVFEDMQALEATKTSFKMARQNVSATILMTTTCVLIIGIAFLLVFGVNLGFAWIISRAPSAALEFTAHLIEYLLYIVIISAGIIASVFVFYTYDELTMRKDARHMHTKHSSHPLKRKH